jgi:hypothetical protein
MARGAVSPGKALARERALWLRQRARAELQRLREALRAARERRRRALTKARVSCRVARERVRDQIRAYRSAEFARINAEVREMRNAARNQCQARKHRIRSAGARALERHAAEFKAETQLQRRLGRADRLGKRKRNTAIERRQESDDAVRSNLPRELVPVFDRVRRHIHGSRYRTRTEAFLEWAEEHPEDVLQYQGDATDSEVRRLVAEYEATARELRKTKPTRSRRVAGVPF